ncbi:hypothetical protein B566_EDAN012666, partial [Ephemera danica]
MNKGVFYQFLVLNSIHYKRIISIPLDIIVNNRNLKSKFDAKVDRHIRAQHGCPISLCAKRLSVTVNTFRDYLFHAKPDYITLKSSRMKPAGYESFEDQAFNDPKTRARYEKAARFYMSQFNQSANKVAIKFKLRSFVFITFLNATIPDHVQKKQELLDKYLPLQEKIEIKRKLMKAHLDAKELEKKLQAMEKEKSTTTNQPATKKQRSRKATLPSQQDEKSEIKENLKDFTDFGLYYDATDCCVACSKCQILILSTNTLEWRRHVMTQKHITLDLNLTQPEPERVRDPDYPEAIN